VQDADAGNYSVVLSTLGGSVTSSVVSLTVIDAPVITNQPASRTNNAGTTATFTVGYTGTSPGLQWYKNNNVIGGATGATLTLNNVQDADVADYTVVLSNAAGSVTSAPPAHLTVIDAPVITSQPVSLTNNAGTTAIFMVGYTGTSPNLQWYKNSSAITNATSATLTLTNVQDADAANYSVILNNAAGSVTSSVISLIVIDAPVITNQPVSLTNNAGTTAIFMVGYTGTSPSLQWYKGSSAIGGATSATLTLSNVMTADAANYTIALTNAAGSVTSSIVSLMVIDPVIQTNPASLTVKPTSNAVFSVVAAGTPALTYQWKQNGTNAPFATARTATLTVSNASSALNGFLYSVVVSNALGQSVTSSPATLGVAATPITITAQPAALTRLVGQPAIFTVKATGAAPFTGLTYQWSGPAGVIAGATFASYTNSAVTNTDAGNYSVAISNAVATMNSASALLTVNADIVAPAIAIVAPKTKFETNVASFVVTGTAADNARVSQVLVQVGTDAFANATVSNTAPGAATWSATVTLVAGTNTIVAKAVDFTGNSVTSAPVLYFREVASAFTVVTNTSGSGTVIIAPAPASGSNYWVGRTYAFTATPATGSLLSNIVNAATSTTTIYSNATPLKGLKKLAVLAENDNTVTINFVTNRFIAAAGIYNGLISGMTVTKESAGYLTLKATAKLGYSGQLTLDGDIWKLSGSFDVGGASRLTIPRGTVSKPDLTVSLQMGFDTTLGGSVSDSDWSSVLDADQAMFSAVNPATSFAGNYTLVIPGTSGDATQPAGDGYATITVKPTGAVSAAGVLGDNDVFAPVTTTLSADGRWPLFSRQYGNTNGIVIGWVYATNNAANSTLIATNLYWIKEADTRAFYPAGFTNAGFTADGSVVPAGTMLTFANGTNGVASLLDGNLPDIITNRVGITLPANLVTILGTNHASMKFSFTAANGLVTGSFNNAVTGNSAAAVKGVYLPSTNYQYVGGYFLGTNQSGSLLIQ
jgi:hypothetical protein